MGTIPSKIAWHDPDPLNQEKKDLIKELEPYFEIKRF
jgi:hypothetical protein